MSSTAPTNLEVNIEILVFRRLSFRLALRGCCALILFNSSTPFRHAALVLLDQGGKPDRPIIGDLDVRRGASNPHGRDRGVDLHIAGLRYLPGNEGERALGQTEQGRIGLAVRVIHELVQNHAGVARKIESGAVVEGNANLAVGPGLDHVALVDWVTDLGLAGATRGGEIRLNDHGIRMLDCNRTRRLHHFSNWIRFETCSRGLCGVALRPHRFREHDAAGEKQAGYQYGECTQFHRALLADVPSWLITTQNLTQIVPLNNTRVGCLRLPDAEP